MSIQLKSFLLMISMTKWPSDQAWVIDPSNFSLWVLVDSRTTNTGIGLYNIGLRKKKLKSAWKFIFEKYTAA